MLKELIWLFARDLKQGRQGNMLLLQHVAMTVPCLAPYTTPHYLSLSET